MAPSAQLSSLEKDPATRLRIFLMGTLGLLLAVFLAVAVEAGLRGLGGRGRAPDLYFVAAAAMTPVLALGLLVQLVTAMTGRTRALLREVTRFEEEMSARPPELNEETHRARELVRGSARRFAHVVMPFGAGLAVQVVITEAVAIYCVAAGVEERGAAIALGAEIIALLAYLLLFSVLLARLTREREAAGT
ncbi:MAG: hypothetical protein H0U24_05560 [Thermoleophilaceae bacterium]|nr:hypothetical protein [Thermoleophilaceae bacterium]